MNDIKQSTVDLATPEQLKLDYNHADQASDAKRFSEFLAEDVIVQTPGVTRNRGEYRECNANPHAFRDLALLEVTVGILGDVALIHGRARYTMRGDGVEQESAVYGRVPDA